MAGLGTYEMGMYFYILNENGMKLSKILKLGILYGAKHSYTGLYFSEGLFSFNHLSIKISLVLEALYYIFSHSSVMAKLSDITIKPTIYYH